MFSVSLSSLSSDMDGKGNAPKWVHPKVSYKHQSADFPLVMYIMKYPRRNRLGQVCVRVRARVCVRACVRVRVCACVCVARNSPSVEQPISTGVLCRTAALLGLALSTLLHCLSVRHRHRHQHLWSREKVHAKVRCASVAIHISIRSSFSSSALSHSYDTTVVVYVYYVRCFYLQP